jgi:broad specificity phosphatase PhoE
MLAIVRHGRAVGNTSHRFIGWSEVPLDDVGRRQSDLVADRLAGSAIERIVASDLRRTLETARPLADRLHLDVIPEPRLREIANGEWTGLEPAQIAESWPELWTRYVGGDDVQRPGGERWADVRVRVRETLAELAADGVPTAVFTHGGPVLLAAEWALGLTLPGNIFQGPLAVADNTSITTVENGKLVGYGDTGHLGGLRRLDIPYATVGEPDRG